MINYKNPLTHEYIMKKNFYPFLVYQINLILYVNYTFPMASEYRSRLVQPDDFWIIIGLACLNQFILFSISIYYISFETLQLIKGGDYIDYFCSIWNYLDFVPPVLIVFMVIDHVQLMAFDEQENANGIAI
jgi:hypothetical protein